MKQNDTLFSSFEQSNIIQTQLKANQNRNKSQYSKDGLYYGRKHCPHSAQNHRLGSIEDLRCIPAQSGYGRTLGDHEKNWQRTVRPSEVFVFMLKEENTML